MKLGKVKKKKKSLTLKTLGKNMRDLSIKELSDKPVSFFFLCCF